MSDVIEGTGPLRHFRVGRRALLQSLATGVGAAALALPAAAQHAHHAAVAAPQPEVPETTGPSRAFLDDHAFETLTVLSEQIIPGARAAQVPEFLDRLLAVETTETQKRYMQALGAFESEARAAHGKPWKQLATDQATALLTKISTASDSEPSHRAFVSLKWALAEAYYATEAGMKELGWDGNIAFAPPAACG